MATTTTTTTTMATLTKMEPRLISCSACRYHKIRCIVEEGQVHCQRCRKRGEVCMRRETRRALPKDYDAGAAANDSDDFNQVRKRRKASVSPSPLLPSERYMTEVGSGSQRRRRSGSSRSSIRRDLATVPDIDGDLRSTAETPTDTLRQQLAEEEADDSAALLSNPLKLLAQASHEVQRDDQLAKLLDVDANEKLSGADGSTSVRAPRAWDLSNVVTTCDVGALARWTRHFSAGLYQPQLEQASLSPVKKGLLSSSRAASLYHDYIDGGLNDAVPLLDPEVHTFQHILHHPTLATVLFYLAARHATFAGASELVGTLEAHFLRDCLPHVVLDGCKTVEIVISLILFASHHPFAARPSEDRAWTLLGHGLRIATELDLSSRLISEAVDDPVLKRQFLARERAWIQLWLATQSLGTATGRRQFLGPTGIIQDCQKDRYRKQIGSNINETLRHGDAIALARVQLNHIFDRLRDLFRNLTPEPVATSEKSVSQRCVMEKDNLEYYLSRIHIEIEQWFDEWSMIKPALFSYGNYIRVLLISMALQGSSSNLTRMEPALARLYEAVTAYLDDFSAKDASTIGKQPNTVLVAVTYMAVLSLKLARLSCSSDQYHSQRRPDRLPWVQVGRLRGLISVAASKLGRCADVRAQRYAEYLHWLLESAAPRSQPFITTAASGTGFFTTSPNVDAPALSIDQITDPTPSSLGPTMVPTPNSTDRFTADGDPPMSWYASLDGNLKGKSEAAAPTAEISEEVSFSSIFGDDIFSGPFTADVDQDILAWAQRFVAT